MADDDPSQRVRPGVLDAGRNERSDGRRTGRQMDELVAARPAGEPTRAVATARGVVVVVRPRRRDRVDEDIHVATEPRPVALEPDALDAMRVRVEERFGVDCDIPDYRERVEL